MSHPTGDALHAAGYPGYGSGATERPWAQYRRSQIAELRPCDPDVDIGLYQDGKISLSSEDEKSGSPQHGDMIARNPHNHADQWLIAAKYFAENFEPLEAAQEWQPIETAPKDGTEVIGIYVCQYNFEERPTVYGPWTVAFKNNEWQSSWDRCRVIEYQSDFGTEYKSPDMSPTHWRLLPSPPRAALKPAGGES